MLLQKYSQPLFFPFFPVVDFLCQNVLQQPIGEGGTMLMNHQQPHMLPDYSHTQPTFQQLCASLLETPHGGDDGEWGGDLGSAGFEFLNLNGDVGGGLDVGGSMGNNAFYGYSHSLNGPLLDDHHELLLPPPSMYGQQQYQQYAMDPSQQMYGQQQYTMEVLPSYIQDDAQSMALLGGSPTSTSSSAPSAAPVAPAAPVDAGPPKAKSWADLVSAPAPPPGPVRQVVAAVVVAPPAAKTNHANHDGKKTGGHKGQQQARNNNAHNHKDNSGNSKQAGGGENSVSASTRANLPPSLLKDVNPSSFPCSPASARFFIIKSYSEEDVHKSINHNVWASTDNGNRRLNSAFHESSAAGPIYLFFSVNASGRFVGMAQMTSGVDFSRKLNVWAQDKWSGCFSVKWIFLKDIQNSQLRHITLPNNEGKPVTNSRDTQEVPQPQGHELLVAFAGAKVRTSILDRLVVEPPQQPGSD
eukprot:gnl/Hemi2/5136_TR1794_c0_g1_i1.p1 gnl/Hemi2/5136_TR1794_c0_g1~~gnl/Hemi2/5136_TR1794_c0_g1_i1.p1  ORF type:complete len:469 (-),score=143.40 gnl/Hemi2/5136_TR1794_c0_g1_i1:250-1656(-)